MTIKQASDLHFTYVRNTPELREVFINKCKEFGILVWGDDDKIGSYLEVFACPFDCDDKFEIVFTDNLEFQSKELFIGDLIGVPTETPEEKEVLDGIESAGEVEWKNGDECVISQKSKSKWLVVGVSPLAKTSTVCVSNTGELKSFHTDQLKKPETPQQRKDREQLENGKAIYDLMCSIELNHDIAGTPNTWAELRDEWQSVYIKLAEEVGYKKEKTHGTN